MPDITLREVRDSLIKNNQMILDEQAETSLYLEAILKRVTDMIKMTKRSVLDQAEKERKESQKPKEAPEKPEKAAPQPSGINMELAGRLTAAALVGLGALSAYFDDEITALIEKTKDDFGKFFNDVQKIFFVINRTIFIPTGKIINVFLETISKNGFVRGVKTFFGTIGRTLGFVGNILGRATTLATAGMTAILPNIAFVKTLGSVFGKIFLPLTIFITAWDTVKGAVEGFNEKGIIGGIEGAVDGFINSLIMKPLELIADATAWVAKKLGFPETAETIGNFNPTEIFDNITDILFEPVYQAVEWIGSFFNDPKDALNNLWNTLMSKEGIMGIVDLIFRPINLGVRAIQTIFGIGDPDNPFRMSTFIENQISRAVSIFSNVFDVGPVSDVTNLISTFIPTLIGRIEDIFVEVIEAISLNSQIMLKKIVGIIQNIPDRLLQFLSENMRIQIPRMAIPVPFSGGREIVITEGNDVGVPGRNEATARIAERNAILQREIAIMEQALKNRQPNIDGRYIDIGQQNLNQAKSAANQVVIDATTVAPSNTTVHNRMDSPVPTVTDSKISLD